MTETIQDMADLGVRVAERFWVLCPCALIENRIDLDECSPCDTADDGKCYNTCLEGCKGTGKVWRLRTAAGPPRKEPIDEWDEHPNRSER